jgi:putative membrane protein
MNTSLLLRLLLLAVLAGGPDLLAADAEPATSWHARSLGQALGYMLLFAGIGIAAAIAGYKLFDKCTPGDLHKEIVENKNVAAAIVAAAVILGVSIIIAAAMMG